MAHINKVEILHFTSPDPAHPNLHGLKIVIDGQDVSTEMPKAQLEQALRMLTVAQAGVGHVIGFHSMMKNADGTIAAVNAGTALQS